MSSAELEIESGIEIADDQEDKGLWEKISYSWLIKNIDSCFKNETSTLTSDIFKSKRLVSKWQIELKFPPSNVLNDLGYLDVYLNAIRIPNDAVIKHTLSVRNSGDGVIISKTENKNHHVELKTSFGHPKMVQLSALLPLIPDKILKIHAEILIKVNSFEMGDIVILGSDFAEVRLQESMNELFESSKLSDVVFEVEEDKLKAHQLILSARSPVFAAMFSHESIEKNSGVVKIVDFESNSFKRFLRFVYSGRVDIPSVDAAIELFRAAEKYNFPDLKVLCEDFMAANLDASNVGPVLLLAETFGVVRLKSVVMDYMLQNITFYSNTKLDVYDYLERKKPKLLTEILVLFARIVANEEGDGVQEAE